jgi:hypothetical protein
MRPLMDCIISVVVLLPGGRSGKPIHGTAAIEIGPIVGGNLLGERGEAACYKRTHFHMVPA